MSRAAQRRAWIRVTAALAIACHGITAAWAAGAEPVIVPPRVKSGADGYPGCYPISSAMHGREGRIVVELEIQPDGSVSGLHFPSGTEAWQRTTAECVFSRMTFTPGTVDGKPVAARASLPIHFSLVGRSGQAPTFDWPDLRSDNAEVEAVLQDCNPQGRTGDRVPIYRFTVGVDGKARSIKLLESSGDKAVDAAGRCVIGQLRFRPLLRGGQAVKSTVSWPLVVRPAADDTTTG